MAELARSPMLSPRSSHEQYNRLKYYSALKTGYRHLGKENDVRDSFLAMPDHMMIKN
jgi:hypothetical protein